MSFIISVSLPPSIIDLMATSPVRTRKLSPQTLGLWALFLLALWLALRLLLVPDPAGGLLFVRAQRLEAAGLMEPALRQYALLVTTHPKSPYVPRALQRQADILTDQARSGKTESFAKAIGVYQQLATGYPQTKLAGEALLAIGSIYTSDLKDMPHARDAYTQVLKGYPTNADFSSEATLRMGRVAFLARDGKEAQTWLQSVLQKYARFPERCAEAQYRLGETYETLFKNKETARNAYEATVKNYPQSVWAGNAKERLGLLLYISGAPRARRVQISISSGMEGSDAGSLDGALLTLLSARGLNVGETVLNGWSLEPFFAGIIPDNLGQAPTTPFTGWQNAAANAGLSYTVQDSSDEKTALRNLQDEVDDAHLALVYSGSWRLVAGYDSEQNLVFLQQGARADKVTTANLAHAWNRSSSVGGKYSLLSFFVAGEDEKVRPAPIGVTKINDTQTQPIDPLAAPVPVAGAKITQRLSPLATPTFVYELKPLSEKEAHQRTLRRAAELMKRSRSGGVLLNGEALRFLANEMNRLAEAPGIETGPNAVPDVANPVDNEAPVRTDNGELPGGDTTATPQPAPTAAPAPGGATPSGGVSGAASLVRARALLGWRNAPLQRWLAARRNAASYLDLVAVRLKNNSLRQAADALREEISALENAAAALPSHDALAGSDGALSAAARGAFGNAAKEIERARAADTRAADLVAAAA